MNKITIHQGHVLEVLKGMSDAMFHACVTDPPYELGFMGKTWDKSGITYNVEVWREVIRVLKPGAHLLAFGGSRTYHRLACAIEDAGFEIRDQIMWLYGSGFPKSLNLGKEVDKLRGSEREDLGKHPNARRTLGTIQICKKNGSGRLTKGNSEWEGWGTALKPAHEPIVVARKPLEGTVVNNVLKYGCGGLNIDGCRISVNSEIDDPRLGGKGDWASDKMAKNVYEDGYAGNRVGSSELGRWPANVIHDGSDEVICAFPQETSRTGNRRKKNRIQQEPQTTPFTLSQNAPEYTNGGNSARFFYCAKASPSERNLGLEGIEPRQRDESRKEGNPGGDNPRNRGVLPKANFHPTVKPLALMRYLCRLVTPPGGKILDCFSGSGSTLIAAAQEGFEAVGVDIDPEYCDMAAKRLKSALGLLADVEVE